MLVDPVSVTGPGTVVTFKQIEKVPQLQRKKKKNYMDKMSEVKVIQSNSEVVGSSLELYVFDTFQWISHGFS